ncbi:MAG TPA: hypothetical protein VGO11_16245 [Chthoniobacteraceae bacterium]|nr:hypothetical protein [Chthoniobacteraceae bacterium]
MLDLRDALVGEVELAELEVIELFHRGDGGVDGGLANLQSHDFRPIVLLFRATDQAWQIHARPSRRQILHHLQGGPECLLAGDPEAKCLQCLELSQVRGLLSLQQQRYFRCLLRQPRPRLFHHALGEIEPLHQRPPNSAATSWAQRVAGQ